MPERDKWFDFTDLRGGRNGGDPATGIDPDQVNEALNIDYNGALVGHKRGGSTGLSLTFSSGGPFASGIQSLFRHVPSSDEAAAEMWGIDGAGLIGRLANSTQWAQVPPKDAIISDYALVSSLSFNRKLYFFAQTGVNRSQLWDGVRLRRVGLAPPTAPPTSGTSGGGSVTDTRRYWSSVIIKSGSVVTMRSELSASYVTQALAGEDGVITLAGAPGENETHWEVWSASTQDGFGIQHYVGEAVIGATITDNNATLTGVSPAPVGTYLLPPAAKYAVSDGDRILWGGNYQASSSYGQIAPKSSRVWWGPRLGDRDISDDERVVITTGSAAVAAIRNYLDIDDAMTGMGGPIDGSFYIFAYRRTWRFSPTGQISSPYRRVPLGVPYGCIFHKGICLGEDEHGNSALYFPSIKGMCRIDSNGPVFCGWDNLDVWGTINLSATVPVHTVYHYDTQQLWVDIATGSNSYPDTRLVFDTKRGTLHPTKGIIHGWTKHTGISCEAICSVMFAKTVGASMSLTLKPYVGRSSGTTVLKCDTTDLDDAGTPFQAYVEKVLAPPVQANFRLAPTYLLASAQTGVSLRQSLTPDFGKQNAKVADVSLAPVATETKIWRMIEDSALSGIDRSATARLGDSVAVANAWSVDQWKLAVDEEQPL